MLSAFWLSLYGACLSSLLAVFTVYKYFLEQRFLVVSVDAEWTENEQVEFIIWMMNSGAAPISIREIWVGSSKPVSMWSLERYGLSKHALLHPIRYHSEVMASNMGDKYGIDGQVIKIGPGDARKFVFAKKPLDESLTRTLDLKKENHGSTEDAEDYIHLLEIRHSRSILPLVIGLKPTKTLCEPGEKAWRPSRTAVEI